MKPWVKKLPRIKASENGGFWRIFLKNAIKIKILLAKTQMF